MARIISFSIYHARTHNTPVTVAFTILQEWRLIDLMASGPMALNSQWQIDLRQGIFPHKHDPTGMGSFAIVSIQFGNVYCQTHLSLVVFQPFPYGYFWFNWC